MELASKAQSRRPGKGKRAPPCRLKPVPAPVPYRGNPAQGTATFASVLAALRSG